MSEDSGYPKETIPELKRKLAAEALAAEAEARMYDADAQRLIAQAQKLAAEAEQCEVNSRARYMQIWRGNEIDLVRRLLCRSDSRTL